CAKPRYSNYGWYFDFW
nr:immunoglobulin heavy chain junction region [Macaca mulatta]MOW75510.1 immunoglobulin heavy chain junction region [Macaca mulatta]MOW75560.1 immunoglobulin heavy chain junction region [Macaca mulatta]MOW75597.1 immunoglobulin heavy chain junction region [Macaca mulatta]MOW76369.1 immunoglobulin heavy chain junction region [Macaca mulatta]